MRVHTRPGANAAPPAGTSRRRAASGRVCCTRSPAGPAPRPHARHPRAEHPPHHRRSPRRRASVLVTRLHPTTVRQFAGTDTLHTELRPAEVGESRDLDENTRVEFDADGTLCAMTVEYARDRPAPPQFSFKQAVV